MYESKHQATDEIVNNSNKNNSNIKIYNKYGQNIITYITTWHLWPERAKHKCTQR